MLKLFLVSLSSFYSAPRLLQGVFRFMYIPAGINYYLRHGARAVSSVSSSGYVVPTASTPATSSNASVVQLPTSSKSLIGICAVVGTFLLVIIIWQIRTIISKRRRARAAVTARARFSYMYGIKEKPAFVSFADTTDSNDSPRKSTSAVLNPAPPDPYARWVPQIKGVTVPPIAVTHAERSPKVQDEYPPTPKSGPLVSPLPSPPPAYRILGLHPIPVPESPPQELESSEIPPPTPMHRNPNPRKAAPAPVRESFDLPPVPTPSPRSASFQHATDTTSASTPRASLASSLSAPKSFPRLMIVTTSFDSTLPDELSMRAGETLRLIREFDDEWCLVQRVGLLTAEKGVVPRFCLSERPRVVKDCVRFSNSIFNTVRRK